MIALPQQKNKGVRCLEINGINHRVSMTDIRLDLKINNIYSFFSWVYLYGYGDGTFGGTIAASSDLIYPLWLTVRNKNIRIYAFATGTSNYYEMSNNLIELNQWYFIGIVAERNADSYIYLNDSLVDTFVARDNTGFTGYELTLGDLRPSRNIKMNGLIDDVRIYNRALSAEEVANLYKGRTVDDTGLVARWKMNEGNGSILHDSVGSNDGTIYGAEWVTSRRRI